MRIDRFTKAFSSSIIFYLAMISLSAQAYPDGITGVSGYLGSTCSGCHGGGSYSYLASLTPTGGTVVARNTAVTMTFSISKLGGADAKDTGLNVASPGSAFNVCDRGTLSESSSLLQLMPGSNNCNEITHVFPQPSNSLTVGSGNVGDGYIWPNFTWTSPNSSGSFTLYGCGNLVNGNRDGNLGDANFGETGDNPTCTTLSMTVNNPPVVTTSGGSAAHTEQVAVPVDGALLLTDTEDNNMLSASITISGNYSAASGDGLTLSACPSGATCTGNGTQTINISGGTTPSVANYQAALRSVSFNTTSDTPSTLTRTVQFSVTDTFTRCACSVGRE
jgi:hypothetical protein